MGLPAVQAAGQAPAQVNDIVLHGYFTTVDEGSEAKRLMVGFGSGAPELKTVIEGFQMTPQGLHRVRPGRLLGLDPAQGEGPREGDGSTARAHGHRRSSNLAVDVPSTRASGRPLDHFYVNAGTAA